MLNKPYVLVLFLCLVFPCVSNAQVVINEVMYDLSNGSDSGREWIELKNGGTSAIDLTGSKISDNNENHKAFKLVQGSLVLPAGGFGLIVENSQKFLTDWPGFLGTLFQSSFSLSNDKETLVLKKGATVVDTITYTTPPQSKTAGSSLQKMQDGTWQFSVPTPGKENVLAVAEISPKDNSTGLNEIKIVPIASSTPTTKTIARSVKKFSKKTKSAPVSQDIAEASTTADRTVTASVDDSVYQKNTGDTAVEPTPTTGTSKWIWCAVGIVGVSILSVFFLPRKKSDGTLTADDIEIVE